MLFPRIKLILPVILLFLLLIVPAAASAERIRATLTGYEEVPPVSTEAGGQLRGRISNDEQSIEWSLTYSGLEGAVQQADIHFAQAGVNGGIAVFLCTNLNNGPAGTQGCPQSGTIQGTIMAADVSAGANPPFGAIGQRIEQGELDELIKAIRAGTAYANVHSAGATGGEIRGQIRSSRRD